MNVALSNEPRHKKTGFLPMRKQRRRSASHRSNCEADQRLCFRYTDSTLSLLIKSEISSFYAASGTGHVGMLPPFYRTFTQNEDVITSNKCLKYNYPTKTQKAYTYGWFDLKCFLGRLRQARLTSNQSAVYLALPEGTSSLYLFL